VTDEKQLPSDIPLTEAGSKHSGDLPTTNQDVSTRSISWGPPVMMTRKQVNRMMKHQSNRGGSGAYRGSEPLNHEGHEALAQFLATPKPMREFKSTAALAEHHGVTRMTVSRWQHDPLVLRRAEWLSNRNKLAGVLIARSNYPRMVEALVRKAITGDTPAARVLHEIAWTEDTPADDTPKEVALRVVYDDDESR
jgi:hypothetical protein